MEEFLAGLGLIVNGPILLDDRPHKLGTVSKPKNKSGWYIGHEVPFKMIVAGDFRKGRDKAIWKASSGGRIPAADLRRMEALVEEQRRLNEAEREHEARTAGEKARERLSRSRLLDENDIQHPYLKNKELKAKAAWGLRMDGEDLLIPMENRRGEIVGLQSISASHGKYFQKGQRSKDAVYRLKGDSQVYICEGFATGASIHLATGGTVYCAMSAANMPVVAKWVRQNNLDKCITVCADNDNDKDGNIGIVMARKASEIALASYVSPQDPGDFDDIRREQGLDILKSILVRVLGKKSWAPLGKLKGVYYVYDFNKSRIREFKSWSTSEFYELEPLADWEKRYPPLQGARGKVDWEQAKSDMIQAIDQVGGFIPSTIRGAGVWPEKGGIVYSTGQALFLSAPGIAIAKPIEQKTSHLEGRYILGRGTALPHLPNAMASLEERMRLVQSILGFPWASQSQARHMIGWLIIARMGACFPIRPYVWLTGPSGSGKSTFLKLVKQLFGDHGYWVQGGTTEAGLRQMTSGTNLPVIFDEFEVSEEKESQTRITKVLDLLRSSWSEDSGQVVKGSVEGTHQIFVYRSPALVASIRVSLPSDADESRFSICELGSGTRRELDIEWINPELGGKLLSWALPMAGQIGEVQLRIRKELLALGHKDRYADQHSLLLAAAEAVGMEPLLDHDAPFVDGHGTQGGQIVADEVECLGHLCGTSRRDLTSPGSFSIQRMLTNGEPCRELADHGILVLSGERYGLWVADKHASLKDAYRMTRWAKGWGRSLKRLPGAIPLSQRLGKLVVWGTLIPMETIEGLQF